MVGFEYGPFIIKIRIRERKMKIQKRERKTKIKGERERKVKRRKLEQLFGSKRSKGSRKKVIFLVARSLRPPSA